MKFDKKINKILAVLLLAATCLGALPAKADAAAINNFTVCYDLPEDVTVFTDVVYDNTQRNGKMDVAIPNNADGSTPIILTVHGGGWNSGDKWQHYIFDFTFLNQGYAVASMNYDLNPKATILQMNEAVKKAIRFIADNARSVGVDPNKIILMGDSAGAHLAALAAAQLTAAGTDGYRIAGLIDFFGPTDMSVMYDKAFGGNLFTTMQFAKMIDGKTSFSPKKAFDKIDPVKFVTPNMPPTLIIHGDADRAVPVECSQNFARVLERNGVPNATWWVPGADHGWDEETMFPVVAQALADVFPEMASR